MPGRDDDDRLVNAALDVFVRFLRLGCTSFGGPVAHLGYFRHEFVERAAWLEDDAYGEIVALCSVLPGPTSSQVGMALGARRAGPAGALLAWLGFTAPSAVAMTAFALALRAVPSAPGGPQRHAVRWLGALTGLECVAAAVIAVAVIAMARTLVRSRFGFAAACAAFAGTLTLAGGAPGLTWLSLAGCGLAGGLGAPPTALPSGAALGRGSIPSAVAAAVLFVLILVVVPLFAASSELLALFSTTVRAGSLVFGGGHVVLPFLETVVRAGDMDETRFLDGYGAAQAVPGPLFTFVAFIGASDGRLDAGPVAGALVALLGIFLPSFLLLAIAAPLWSRLRALPRAANVLTGLNAAVVGILAAVLVDPIALQIAHLPPVAAGSIVVGAFVLLQFARVPSWAVVLLGAAAGSLAFGRGTG